MIEIPAHGFMFYAVLNIILIYIGCLMIVKCIKSFPRQLIPIVAVSLSVLTSIAWCINASLEEHPYFFIFIGAMEGLATVGVNQIFRQLRQYFRFKKQAKLLKNGENIGKTIS